MNKIVKNILIFSFVFGITSITSCSSDKDSCEWLVKQYFLASEFPDVKDYVAKEEFDYQLSHPPFGEIFKVPLDSGWIKISYRNIHEDSETSVYAVTLSSESLDTDMYCHLHNKEGSWKIHAVREVAMTGIYFAMIAQLDSLPSIPDSLLFEYTNAKLVVTPDSELKEYFKLNENKFNQVIKLFNDNKSLSHITTNKYNKVYTETEGDDAKELAIGFMKELYLQSIMEENNYIKFLIGGIMDNAVFIYYVPKDQSPPIMSPNDNIYVEEIAPHWYIVKTT